MPNDMKLAKSIAALPILLTVGSGCSDSYEPLPEPDFRLPDLVSSITSEYFDEEYIYDDENRIAKWISSSSSLNQKVSCVYEYPDDNTITMDLSEQVFFEPDTYLRHFDVSLTLDNEGKITVADGIFNYTKNDLLMLRKKYRHEFEYDDSGHLVSIKCTEWMANRDGWDMDHPWQWVNTLTWDGDNLIRYEDYNGSSKPQYISEYSYSGIPVAKHKPNVFPTIISGYIPLQLTGRFGKQSEGEVMGRTVTNSNGNRSHNEYAYEFTKTAAGPIISRFWEYRDNGFEIEYRVKWLKSR